MRTALGLSVLARIVNGNVDYLRHGHGEAFDSNIGVEWLQDVLGHQRLVDAGLLVLMDLWQHALPNVDHLDAFGGGLVPWLAVNRQENSERTR